jgi:hypothetical protein
MNHRPFRPYELTTISLPVSKRRRTVEVISRPFSSAGAEATDRINVRMVPGEPTTLTEVAVADLEGLLARMRWLHVAEVSTRFPYCEDMLRYDIAALFDHTVSEVAEIPSTWPDSPETVFQVWRLSARKKPAWTYTRWHSFGAFVKPLYVRDLLRPADENVTKFC